MITMPDRRQRRGNQRKPIEQMLDFLRRAANVKKR